MKKGMVIAWLTVLAFCIGILFWHSEWKYSLPTPLPPAYHEVPLGTAVNLPVGMPPAGMLTKRPVFLHFFNPGCPCSRFNISYFSALASAYGQDASFALVLMSDQSYSDDQIRKRFNLAAGLTILHDTTLAARYGVYSTPQAVIIDAGERLYYRGNYNRARYCTDEKTGFAKMALEGLLHKNLAQSFSPLALKAYGCQLPTCTQ